MSTTTSTTTTVIPSEYGWKHVTVHRFPGEDPEGRLQPVLCWLVRIDGLDVVQVGAVVIGDDGVPRPVRGGRFANVSEQSDSDYADVLAAAVAEYRDHEAAVMSELIDGAEVPA